MYSWVVITQNPALESRVILMSVAVVSLLLNLTVYSM